MADPTPGRDGVEWIADELKKLKAAIAALQSPSGTQLFNSVPKLEQAIEDLQAQALVLQATVDAIPVTRTGQATGGGFTPTTSWQTVASMTLARPTGKPNVGIAAWGFVNVDWTSSSGSAWPAMQMRVIIDGDVGPATGISGAIQAGSSLNAKQSGVGMHARSVYAAAATVTVEVQMLIASWVVGPGAVTWNSTSSQVAASATFTN